MEPQMMRDITVRNKRLNRKAASDGRTDGRTDDVSVRTARQPGIRLHAAIKLVLMNELGVVRESVSRPSEAEGREARSKVT